jgi:hypothetical protein
MDQDSQKNYKNFKKKRHLTFLNYDKKRHLELLKKKSISIESEENYPELLKYSAMLNRHLDWETCHQYLELLEEFLKENISISDFCSEFCERGSLNSDAVAILESNSILLSPHEKSLEFSELLEEIFDECQYFDGEEDLTGDEFRNSIEKSFVKIKKYLNEK